jgi:hypothetical protein
MAEARNGAAPGAWCVADLFADPRFELAAVQRIGRRRGSCSWAEQVIETSAAFHCALIDRQSLKETSWRRR